MVVRIVRGRPRIPRPVPLTPPADFADHFSSIARRYAEYRPRYPQALADALAARCSRHDAAWDAGCGNGQLSVQLATHFARVYAQDPSQAQLDAAQAHPRVEYRCAKAEQSGLPDRSVDLAVAAQAAHWFDWPRFLAEVERVTIPGALVALVSYGILVVEGDAANTIVQRYYRVDAGPYLPPGRAHVENGYRDLHLPWPPVEAPPLAMSARWSREELVGYLTTWS
ncbi:MAG TPA: class I SAM-dependent methyltransferase, partial [Kofleriaceae bacterium]|nr:class I SAM-dependent methyltransferase [Kofleriaceae bacterium]